MKPYEIFNLRNLSKILFLNMLLLVSCNSKVVTHANKSKAKLPVLWISKTDFQTWKSHHDTKVMFRFTYFNKRIALTGWAPKNNDDNEDDYDTTEVLQLNPSLEKQIKLTDQRIYLGNLRVTKLKVESLDSQLNNPLAHDLVFIPILDSVYPQQVAYQIYISKSSLSKDILPTYDPKLDPSPPASRR